MRLWSRGARRVPTSRRRPQNWAKPCASSTSALAQSTSPLLGIECESGLDVLLADFDLTGLLVNEGAVGKGAGGARVEFDGAVQVGEGFVVGFGAGLGEATALQRRPDILRIEGQRLRKILERCGKVAQRQIGFAAQNIDFGVVHVEGGGAGDVFDGLLIICDRKFGAGAVEIALNETAVGGDARVKSRAAACGRSMVR